ncbi:MAG: diguanylate cyclase [Proteobacteria bacterium]|nr:diguanylate cyclase [Pseudomonadota bacterium]
MPPEVAGRIVARSHWLRTLGLALGSVMVGTVFYRHAVPIQMWVLLVLHGLAWPQVAWLILRRSNRPVADDRRFFLGDAAMGGAWIALMQFNLLPTVLLVTMYAITLVAIGGFRYLAHGFALLAIACGVASVANGLSFAPDTGMPELLASLPLLVVFPVSLGLITHKLAHQVRAQNRQLLRLGSLDALSGLLNRKHWEDAVNAILARHCCDNAVMLLIDIDRFKHINDQFGHTVGDEVIRQVGAIIRGSLREGDLAGRYGGDEFGVVLCNANLPAAAAVAERIRSGVAELTVEKAPQLRCTLSIGLAHSADATGNTRDWIEQADAALYRAKLAGRNRLVVAA